MNKTIYLKDDEGSIWERARDLAGDKLSPVIVTALKQFIATRESETRGFERIEVEFNDSKDHHLPKRKAFHGRWIFPKSKPLTVGVEDSSDVHYYAVALGAKGGAVIFHWYADHVGQWGETFSVYSSLQAAAEDEVVNYAAREAIRKLGVPVEELDI